jgi:hypothetical protein
MILHGAKDVAGIGSLITQSRTVENNGKKMREGLEDLQANMDDHIQKVLAMIKDQPRGSKRG